MSKRWKSVTFADAPIQIIDGDRGKNYPKQTDFADVGFCVFLNTGNVTDSGFNLANVQFISEAKDDELRKGKLTRGDVVMTTRGTIGNVAYYNENIPFDHARINSGMVIFRCDQNQFLPLFLYHYLQSPSFHDQVNSLQSGVAQPQLPIRDIRRIELPLPSLVEQSGVTELIAAYDSLIENNLRRMALLEESARLLYREWFVRLRFPGYEHTRIVNGVPEGWEKKKLPAVADVNRNTISGSFDGEIEYVDISSVSPGRINETTLYEFRDAPGRARRVVRHGDIIWSCVRPNRRSHTVIWQPPANLIVSTGFAVISPTALPTSFLYFAT
ncbi:MAG: restriction endonuclease subunit S, partial [Candidatus Binatia bacterium]